jgi:hypothetical protein
VSETETTKSERAPAQVPTLLGYYTDPKIKPAQFFKAVRAAKIKVFHSDDVDSARVAIVDKDPDLARTVSLGLGNRPPEAVERWAIDAVRSILATVDPNILLQENSSAEAIFEQIVGALGENLQSSKKSSRLRAQNLVKLTLLWLTRRRSLDPLHALYTLSSVVGKRAQREAIRVDAQKIILRANLNQWKTLVVISNLSSEEIKEANQNRDRAIQTRDLLQAHVNDLERVIESKQQEADGFSKEVQRLGSELSSERDALEAQRRLREFDATETAARTRNLLSGRLTLLLSDARSALDFDPPHIEAARQRIDAAKDTIAREVDDSNG